MGILKHLQNLGASMRAGGATFGLFPSIPTQISSASRSRYEISDRVKRIRIESGFTRDAENLRSDWNKVGDSLKIAYRKYSEK